MGKIFTITEGLENMGALRTGGQGSVYKGRRIGEIITAVKLLPTPIHTENEDDKNFRDFQNEVAKLKKVNEEPNPNVVKILNSGITESGSFPFIEMEYIEGPDLEELLKAPHDPVFSIRETIKVADQLSSALAHCHKVDVKHGDIKSNNVKFNIRSGNYILLDFGLSVMSDEQRRSSLRHAGAIEFMAPEQNEGKMFFQTDVYSFGVILFELLAGTVPFPLSDNGETSRNTVMVSHMETPLPDVLNLRKNHLPEGWSQSKKETEMNVPAWLLSIIDRCLAKNPEHRFRNGLELHEAIISHSSSQKTANDESASIAVLQSEVNRLNGLLMQYQNAVASSGTGLSGLQENPIDDSDSSIRLSKPIFFTLLLLLVGLGGIAAYTIYNDKSDGSEINESNIDSLDNTEMPVIIPENNPDNKSYEEEKAREAMLRDSMIKNQIDSVISSDEEPNQDISSPDAAESEGIDTSVERPMGATTTKPLKNPQNKKYTLAVSKAFFYDDADRSTRRDAHLVDWNNPELTAIEEKNGFIYVVFFNNSGQITRGWLRKSDLKRIGI